MKPERLGKLARIGPMLSARKGLGLRGVMLIAAYTATSAVVLISAVGLGRTVSPAVLATVLSVFFVVTLSSGLEPGTSKAALVDGMPANVTRSQFRAIALASTMKALGASLPLGVIWTLSDTTISVSILLWLPALVMSGFLATDFRVLLDGQGRHTAAIWLKQSSLIVVFATLATLVALGAAMDFAVAGAALARLAWTGLTLIWVYRGAPCTEPHSVGVSRLSLKFLSERHWLHFAIVSVLAAGSGSFDRVVALRLLSTEEYNAYFILYEIVTKFWLLPYIVAPILFARRVSGSVNDRLMIVLYSVIAVAGFGFVAILTAFSVQAPSMFHFVTGLSSVPVAGLLFFGVGVVISSFTQLFLVELQARKRARWATLLTISSLVVSGVMFYAFTAWLGLVGLLVAWFVKSSIELALAFGGLKRAMAQ